MPRVPKRQVGAGVQSAGFPGSGRTAFTPPSVSSGAAIADLGQSVSGAALTLGRIEQADKAMALKVAEKQAKDEEKLLNTIDTNYATQAANAYRTARLDLDREAMSKSQKDVVGLRQDMLTKRLKLKSDVAGKFRLTGRRLNRYDKLVATGDFNFDKSVSTHELKELEVWRVNSGTTKIANAMEDGARNVGSLTDVIAAKSDIELGARQSMPGADEATIQKTIADDVSTMISDGITLVASTNAANAKVFFDQYDDFLNADAKTDLNKLILKESIPQDGKALRDQILLQTDDFDEQMELVNNEKNAEVGDNARKRLVADDKINKERKKRENTELDSGLLGEILQNKRDRGLNSYQDSFDLTFKTSSPEAALKMQKQVDAIYKATPVKTNDAFINKVYNSISADAYSSLGALRLATAGKLSDADQKEVENFWQAGGLLGGLKETDLKNKFNEFFFAAGGPEGGGIINTLSFGLVGEGGQTEEDVDKLYMSYRRYIVQQAGTLPAGREKITSTDLDTWSAQAFKTLPTTGGKDATIIEIQAEGLDILITPVEREAILNRLGEMGALRSDANVMLYHKIKSGAQ